MKTLSILLCVIFIYCCSQQTSAQYNFSDSEQLVRVIDNNTIQIFQVAHFSMGSPSSCPMKDTFNISVIEDTVRLYVRYDVSGGWQTNFCSRLDTFYTEATDGSYTVVVNSWVYSYNEAFDEHDSAHVDSDTIYMVQVSVLEQQQLAEQTIGVFPNPANELVRFKIPQHISLESIMVYDLLGKVVIEVKSDTTQLDVSSLPKGQYILRINTSNGVQIEQLLVE